MNCTTNHQPPTTPLTLASRSRRFFELEFALSNMTRGRTHQPVERTEGTTGKSWKQCSLSVRPLHVPLLGTSLPPLNRDSALQIQCQLCHIFKRV